MNFITWPSKKYPDKKSFLVKLLESGPIEVQHKSPTSLTPDGKECWGADKDDFQCFNDFWYFADWVNKLYSGTSGPIRLQELNDTLISGRMSSDSPAYGRRYEIYYNQCNVGILQIMADLMDYPQDRSVYIEARFDECSPRLLPFSDLFDFLRDVARLVTSRKKEAFYGAGENEYTYAIEAVRHAMLELVWETSDDFTPSLEIYFTGRPDNYFRYLEMHKKQHK